MDYYSVVKNNDTMTFEGKQMKLVKTVLGEVTQPERQACNALTLTRILTV